LSDGTNGSDGEISRQCGKNELTLVRINRLSGSNHQFRTNARFGNVKNWPDDEMREIGDEIHRRSGKNELMFICVHIMPVDYPLIEKAMRRVEVREMMSSCEMADFYSMNNWLL
jgi:hypothetical protein